ncbi:hairy-related 3 [Danio rerio]|uniref:HER-3 protein n=1 Tax=Danio rerio TaxID=7955 RepID=Q90465_DANRE|nr:hairy-related 3 [Danio rerio]AAI52287.1 Hairy-related 3 [Danio rerio]CAA65996.1 HER-3 protein [Danio rerio]|eukprot:NP_571155.1 transcription factor HES-3 [Danio rerio]
MAAASNSAATAKPQNVKKVSKPLMEKKRRARINKCLNQLKSLLESACSNNIRKRKLEKADILELTVKHLRHLQNTKRGLSKACDSAEYHAGYRSCLNTVSHYLRASDTDRDSRSIMLTNLTSGLNHNRVPDFSTVESDPALIFTLPSTLRRPHKVPIRTDVSYSSFQQTAERKVCLMPKRTEIGDSDRMSLDAALRSQESKKAETTHFRPKDLKVIECCIFKQNYWRPW